MTGNWKWKLSIIATMLDVLIFVTLLWLFRSQVDDLLSMGNNRFLFALVIWFVLHMPTALIVEWLLSLIKMPHHEYDLIANFLIVFMCSSQTFLVFFLIGQWIDRKKTSD